MFVKFPKQHGLIDVPSNFFELIDIDDSGNLHIRVLYHINQSDVVKKGLHTCRISAITRTAKKINVIHDQRTKNTDTRQVVKNIQKQVINTRNSIKNQENYVLSARYADNTSSVNNEIIPALRSGVPLSQVSQLYRTKPVLRTVGELHTGNDIYPVLQTQAELYTPPENLSPTQHVIQTNLLSHGLDPSHTYGLEKPQLSPHESITGGNNKVLKNSVDQVRAKVGHLYQALHVPTKFDDSTSTRDKSHDQQVIVLSQVSIDKVDINSELILPIDKVRDTANSGEYRQVFIQFDLLNAKGVAIENILKKVDLLSHIDAFQTPKSAPIVKLVPYHRKNVAVLHVQQTDRNAKTARIYKKLLPHSTHDSEVYTLIDEMYLTRDNSGRSVTVPISPEIATILRVVSVGQNDKVGAEYTNVVVKATTPLKIFTRCSLVTKIVSNGINVELREVPPEVIAAEILRRDATIHETTFSNVGDDIIRVDPFNESATYVIVDTSVKTRHVYEYKVRLIYKNGISAFSGNSIVEYVPQNVNRVTTKIEDVLVNYNVNNLDVSFKISTVAHDTSLDTVHNLLKKNGTADFFNEELRNERDKLQDVIAYNVQRVNLTTGVRENFGEISTNEFSDINLRAINGVSPIEAGDRYRYEITTLMRASETLLQNFVKTSIDSETKKSYRYSPHKFLHPVALQDGNITTDSTLSVHYPKSEMAFGNIGSVTNIEVSFAEDTVKLVDASAEVFDLEHDIIRWKVEGVLENIDHFVILREFQGQRKIVGKCHALFTKNTLQYIYKRSIDDIGTRIFVIRPIFNSYVVGTEILTNGVDVQ